METLSALFDLRFDLLEIRHRVVSRRQKRIDLVKILHQCKDLGKAFVLYIHRQLNQSAKPAVTLHLFEEKYLQFLFTLLFGHEIRLQPKLQ